MTSDPLPYVVPLADVRADDLALGGGKAANLGRLLRWGFPVPPGFVVTTAGYDAVVVRNELAQAITEVSQSHGPAAIRADFERATMPPDLEREILSAYRTLGGGAVAVRSSATAEDLPEAAFAGQQETFLGINNEKALLDAVRRCWASLWSDRAIAYRAHHGMAAIPVKLAVIVQRLVPADAAGVLFTANPITGARDETIVEPSTGLGEAVVSGLVTPDHFVLRHSRGRWRIVERHLGWRETEVRQREGGGTEITIGTASTAPTLPDDVLLQLARMGDSIARRFGQPQDIEWAWADAKLFILQSRPITALPDPPSRRPRFEPPRFAADYLQVRPYPLDTTTWFEAMMQALPRMLPLDGIMPPLAAMLVEEDGVVERFADWEEFHFTPRLLLAPARIASLARRHDPAGWRDDDLFAAYLANVRALAARDVRALSWSELLALAREAMATPSQLMEVRRRYLPRGILGLGALRLLLQPLGLADRFSTLLSGVDNMTLQANRALESLATEIRRDPQLAAAFREHEVHAITDALGPTASGQVLLQRFDEFLDVYGHRETGSPLLVSQPTWKDAPDAVLGILKGLARAEPPTRPDQQEWESARDEALAHPLLRLPAARSAFLDILIQARCFSVLREDTHYALTLPMPVLRRALVEMGRRLTDAGILASPEDVFHLRFDQLERVAGSWPPPNALADELRTTARRRAERRETLAGTPLIDLTAGVPSGLAGDALVKGTPGSPGIADGPVRVVRDPSDFGSLLPGEVLVAPYTNPSWTPLFGRAAAVVVDTGAAMSHAAIVAREYRLPAVMGTGDATRRLGDGQWVRVDGSRGLVFAASAPGKDTPAGVTVDADRQHEDGPRGDRLPERGDSVEIERVRHQPQQEDAQDRPGHPAPATTQ
jgi:pyruvate,water dikinase